MNKKVLKQCIRIAEKNNYKHPDKDGYRHFSFVVQNDAICDWSTNTCAAPILIRGYPIYGKIHAEFNVWNKAKGILLKNSKFEVVNMRMTKNGGIRNSCPCLNCFKYLRNQGCYRIWFTTGLEQSFAKMEC
jgi:hypothetical protein